MKKNIQIGTLLLMGLSYCCAANSDSIKVRKNEIGINVRNLLAKAIGAKSKEPEYGISYKRAVNGVYLRTYVGTSRSSSQDIIEFALNDSMDIQNRYSYETKCYYQRIGIEKRKNIRNKVYLVGGIDLIASQEKYRVHRNQTSSLRSYPGFYPISDSYRANELIREVRSNRIGTGFIVSILVPVGKRWLITGETRSDFFYNITTTKNVDPLAAEELQGAKKVESLGFEKKMLLANISISYRL